MEKGDIIKAAKRTKVTGKHRIVYYNGYDDLHFIGGMLTHMQSEKNAIMKETHFNDSKNYKVHDPFIFDNTMLVKAKLIKFDNWGPFEVVGKLTEEGIQFVNEQIENLPEETWEEYLKRTNK